MFLFFKYKCKANFNTYETDTYLPLTEYFCNIHVQCIYSIQNNLSKMHIPGFYNLDPLKSTITVFW